MLASLSLNLAVLLEPSGDDPSPRLAVVQVPSRLPRLVRVPGGDVSGSALLEDVISSELPYAAPAAPSGPASRTSSPRTASPVGSSSTRETSTGSTRAATGS